MKMVWSKNYYSFFSLCMQEYKMYKYSCVPSELLAYKRLIGMCRWLGLDFHEWIDYNGVAFSRELLEWGSAFFGTRSSYLRLANVPECLYLDDK